MSLTFDQIHTEKKQRLLFEMLEKTARGIREIPNDNSKLDRCPICESENVSEYVQAFGFDMSLCGGCGLLFCNPYPNDEQLRAYYSSEMKSFENEFFLESFDHRVRLFTPRVDIIHALKPSGRLLDIGSAIGIFVEALLRRESPLDITCCDLSPEACESLRKRFPDVRVINEDACALTEEEGFEGGYDVVTMWDTIEHIVDQNKMLQGVRDLLADDGIFVFSTPNTHSFEWLTAQEKHTQILPPGHVNLMNEGNIRLLLERNGFDLAEAHTLNASLDITYVQKWLDQKKIDASKAGGFLAEVINDPGFVALLENYLIDNRMAGNILVVARKHQKADAPLDLKTPADVDEALVAGNRRTAGEISRRPFKGLLNETYAPGEADALYISEAQGAYMTDTDGNRLLDLGMAAGSALLGHAHPDVVRAITDQTRRGAAYIRPTFQATDYGEALNGFFPHHSAFALCNSGSEATMRAMRIARAHTGRRRIGVFGGFWHGGQDGALVGEDYDSQANAPVMKALSGGLIWPMDENLLLLPYNSENAFELITKHGEELAMVFVEPAQGSIPLDSVGPFLQGLRDVTEQHGILLGFDEIITGLRLNIGGGAGLYGITPDISTFGKIIGGGLPVGAVGVRDDIAPTVRDGPDGSPPVFMGGTFSANPMTAAAGLAVFRHIQDAGPDLYDDLGRKGQALRDAVDAHCRENALPAHMIGVQSMSRLVFSDKPVKSRRERDEAEAWFSGHAIFQRYCRAAGLHLPSNGILFLSTAHGEDEVKEAARILCDGIDHALAAISD
ncbi:MAG: aminotransferase class III-fold pyridoxal phosphate-dependent enzyme [Rhodospirillales bacterium]|nr:aminotransferase class III-fold pyridoxal phosphate-dependent enzyme [Alphaproteobacteria bacterium]MBL6948878.1 aminotransferase class III-fold pyridoxal phosphate-dependent enzyme [Rhodospirillales bacterium]